MSLTLAALLSVIAAVLEVTVSRYVAIGGVAPHLVLVLAVVWAVAAGLDGGLAAAFAGGIVLDALTQRPLGSSAFSLLIAVALAAAAAAALGRVRIMAPIIATGAGSFVFAGLSLALFAALRDQPPIVSTLIGLVPGAIYDAALAALVGPGVVVVIDRRREAARVDW